MPVQTFSSREFTRDVSAAKRATAKGPVFITDRGRPAYALLKIEDFLRLSDPGEITLLELMEGIPCAAEIDFEVPRLQDRARVAGFD
jgi:PHD/YefM family antitoxin component YafN of YafNO toxin-antitoxin module